MTSFTLHCPANTSRPSPTSWRRLLTLTANWRRITTPACKGPKQVSGEWASGHLSTLYSPTTEDENDATRYPHSRSGLAAADGVARACGNRQGSHGDQRGGDVLMRGDGG